jgi:cytochrome c oxidase subunit 4
MSQIDSIDARHETSELHPSEELRTYWKIFWWLMGLLVLTVLAAQVHLDNIIPGGNVILALIIATIKGSLVVLYFMHVKHSSKLTWLFASAAFIWLAIMIALSFNDYLTRQEVQPLALPDQQRTEAMEHTGREISTPVVKEDH